MAEATTTEQVTVPRSDATAAPHALEGAVFVLIQFDVSEEIQLGRLREIIGARTVAQPSMKHPAPSYIRSRGRARIVIPTGAVRKADRPS